VKSPDKGTLKGMVRIPAFTVVSRRKALNVTRRSNAKFCAPFSP
jgi:hypothetical protein